MVHQGRQEQQRHLFKPYPTEPTRPGIQAISRQRRRCRTARHRFQRGRRDDIPLRQDATGVESGLAEQAEQVQVRSRTRREETMILTSPYSMNSHKRLWNMTKSDGPTGQNYSQDCSICLNSIAVRFVDLPICSLFTMTDNLCTALPMFICSAMLTHMAFQMYPCPSPGPKLPNIQLSQLPYGRRSRGRCRGS